MFALLDIDRACKAFSTVAAPDSWTASAQTDGDVNGICMRTVPELSRTFRDDLAWLYEIGDSTRETRWADRTLYVPLTTASSVHFHVHSRFRPAVAPELQQRLALIQIEFEGGNRVDMLATQDPAHDTVLAFLRLVQPVHAFVTLDHWNPGDDLLDDDPGSYRYFREAGRRVFDSTFLGPELLQHIPPAMLSPEAGFSFAEPIGAGVWITFAGQGFRFPDTDEEEAVVERHRAACQQVETVLKTVR